VSRLPTANPAGIVSRAWWSRRIALGNRDARPIVKAYEKRFGRMNSRSAAGFTAMMTVAQAIRDAGTEQPDRIRDALQRLDLPAAATIMPWDGVKVDANGQNIKAGVVLQQIIGGSYVDVYPDDLAARPVIWPLARPEVSRATPTLGCGGCRCTARAAAPPARSGRNARLRWIGPLASRPDLAQLIVPYGSRTGFPREKTPCAKAVGFTGRRLPDCPAG
jgi:hypothetical protein